MSTVVELTTGFLISHYYSYQTYIALLKTSSPEQRNMKNQLERVMTRKSSNSKKTQPVSSKQQRCGKQKSLPDYSPVEGGGGASILLEARALQLTCHTRMLTCFVLFPTDLQGKRLLGV